MAGDKLSNAISVVTEHPGATILVMVLLSAAVVGGIPQLDTESQASADADAFDDLESVQKAQYVQNNFTRTEDRSTRTIETVYVRDDDGNVLSKESLLAGLRYQQSVRNNESVAPALHDAGVSGFSNLVATRAAGSPNATLAEQIRALEAATPADVERLVARTLQEDPRALRYLPADHERTDTTATDRRMLVVLDTEAGEGTVENASAALYYSASDRSDDGFFVVNSVAYQAANSHFFGEMIELVLPVALGFILLVLGFAYRDLVDVVVGMVGVVLSVLWMFGLLGWLGVAAGTVSVVPVVLISGLSIDFGFHVFNRYREQRGEEDAVRPPMRRGVTLVATALVLVTVTAAIGFLSNLSNPLPLIRNLGISITLGVVSALLVFLTVVPALKIGIDERLESLGLDRRKAPLGHGRYLRPVLARAVTIARRGAPVVLVGALLVGAAGGLAWADLDEESYQQADGEVAEWKQQLPGPLGWDPHPVLQQVNHVDEVYQPASADAAVQEPILIEGDVTSDDTLEDVHAGVEDTREKGLLVDQPGTQAVLSPVTAMQAVAAENESFAAVLERADTDGNGVPDRNLERVYDAFFAADSETASRVIQRTDDGQYAALLVTLSLDADYADAESTVAQLSESAEVMEDGDERSATVAGSFAVNEAVLGEVIGGILLTMAIALGAIAIALAGVFRYMHGSATLGLVVSVPIALVLGLVIGGMYLLAIPLTLLTALLMSLVIGLGVDYNIHIGDRYADERRAGKAPLAALETAVTGTGGALLGSTLTSAGAFATIMLVPHPQLESFGAIVVIAMLTSFVVSVLILPSLLVLWDEYLPASVATTTAASEPAAD